MQRRKSAPTRFGLQRGHLNAMMRALHTGYEAMVDELIVLSKSLTPPSQSELGENDEFDQWDAFDSWKRFADLYVLSRTTLSPNILKGNV